MRCDSCQKMVSYGEVEPTIEDTTVNCEENSGSVDVNVRVVLPCGDCGTELAETTLDITIDFEHECKPDDTGAIIPPEGDQFTIEDELEVEATEDFRPKTTKNKKGVEKPVPTRYQKHYYGARVFGSVHCNRCGEDIPVEGSDDCQSSGFDLC